MNSIKFQIKWLLYIYNLNPDPAHDLDPDHKKKKFWKKFAEQK